MLYNINHPELGDISIKRTNVSLLLMDDMYHHEVEAKRYDIVTRDGAIILYRLNHYDEWIPSSVTGHYPTDMVELIKEVIEVKEGEMT